MNNTLLISEFKDISLDNIDQELSSLWFDTKFNNMADNEEIVRSCSFNLIVVLIEDDGVDAIFQIVSDVTMRYPARVVFITIDPKNSHNCLKGSVAAQCNRTVNHGIKMCHEIIYIKARGKDCEQIDNAAIALLVPDLPTFLWWNCLLPDTSKDEKVFANLLNYCERLIFDSESMVAGSHDISCLACLMPFTDDVIKEISPTAIGDLTWQKLLPWRLMLAKSFDYSSKWQLLNNVNKVTIEYRGISKTTFLPVQASLILGWLATRLGWQPSNNCFISHSGCVDIEIKETQSPDTSQNILHGITLEMERCNVFVRLLDDKSAETGIHIKGGEQRTKVVPFIFPKIDKCIENELNVLGRNKVYEDALRMAAYIYHHWRK